MSERNYIIGTGFYHKPDDQRNADEFFKIWLSNTLLHTGSNPPDSIIVLGNGGCRPNHIESPVQAISFAGNLGHVHQYIGVEQPEKSGDFCGWSSSIITLAMLAHFAECDFVYKEQDCLMFGDCIGQMYKEIGDKKCIFGKLKVMPVAQSLFLVKHDFIPEFCRMYLSTGSERNRTNLPEHKFKRLLKLYPHIFCQFSFGYDRDRPINFDDKIWYAQKFNNEEIGVLIHRELI